MRFLEHRNRKPKITSVLNTRKNTKKNRSFAMQIRGWPVLVHEIVRHY